MRNSVQFAPNVTPMVDVMLVLLIIFMLVAPILSDGFVAQSPQALNFRDHPNDSADVTLGIDAAGRYYLDQKIVDPGTLAQRLESIYAGGRLDHVLYLKADQALSYSKVLAAVDTARNHGVTVIAMITQQPASLPRWNRDASGCGRIAKCRQ